MYAKTLLVLVLGSGLASAQLNTLAVRAGLKYFGTAVNEQRVTDTTYMAIVNNTAEFGSVVPENGQKWAYTEPSQNTFSYTSGDVALAAPQLGVKRIMDGRNTHSSHPDAHF
ncbi:glycosyl hydrolase family 10 [Colletotrichum gloeosporioides Cg-14]|uniref:Glycosyl hydrolase family 10 n=1 Tax=Colletotrichum gloeosporioides (strain Cg-14) TaxID=1237896 RepID=T0LQM1_COLGC|nr:glycosyl hydrolase family 10 [Colletotrichum gloeosporioides Cg-14]